MAKHTVEISGEMAFSPPTITVVAGDCVCWTNPLAERAGSHTVTFDTDDPDRVDIPPSSEQIAPGESFDASFSTAGTYPYHCENHQHMKGVVIVRQSAEGSPLPKITYTGGTPAGFDSQMRPLNALPNDMRSLTSAAPGESLLSQDAKLRKQERDAERK